MPTYKKTVQQVPAPSVEFNFTFPPINLWSAGSLPRKKRMFVKLYTSPTCTNCAPVKERLKAAGIEYVERNVSEQEAFDALSAQGVRAVPYLHAENAVGSEYKALGSGINVKSLKEFLNA